MTPVHVDISNVATWFLSVNTQDEYTWATDFPSMASPWPYAIYNWQEPRSINKGGIILKSPIAGMGYEALVVQGEVEQEHFLSGIYIDEMPVMIYKFTGQKYKLPPGAASAYQERVVDYAITNDLMCRWLQLIILRTGREIVGGAMWLQFLDTSGRFIGDTDSAAMLIAGKGILTDNNASVVLYPLMFALSLMHCRNVEVRDRPVSRQQRRMAERTGKPVITYKELAIDAFRKQVRYESEQSGDNQIKRALHICRGHFATYGEHNPLFGRLTGTFWRPMHVRGNKDAGEVHKTYKVKGEK
jgi:hypothetical protein